MPKLCTVLRSLVLIFLSSWIGIAAPPAAAQQTVTLSGRVTDAAGNAVSGAKLDLFRLPGRIWIDVQNTDGTGAYRFSVPPGTYVLQVVPPGPFIAQNTEELRLSTHTTRDFVLETGVTLSGRVTGPAGQPVPWAWLSASDADGQEVGFGSANESGYYSLGVPMGTYQVNVYSDDFLDKRVAGVAVSRDTVLNITLESGVVLEGTVVDDGGQPVADAQVCAHLPTEQVWEGVCSETGLEGRFQLRVAPAEYVVTVRPVFPLRQTRLRLEIGGEEISDLVLTVSRDPMPFVSDDPPKASLISISPPTADGEVTLHGAAGSVAPHSAVVAITLDTGHFTTAQATASGSFTATLFAPAGTSVLIRADPFGATVGRFLSDRGDAAGASLAGLPGTILRVADPPGAGIPIGTAGWTIQDEPGLPVWTFHGSINTHTFVPGNPLRVQGTVRVDSPALQGVDALKMNIGLWLERLSDTDGSSFFRRNAFTSTFLTPAGLPIERASAYGNELEEYQEVPLVKTVSDQAEARVDLTLTLPPNFPAGYYQPILAFHFPDMPQEEILSRSVITELNSTGRTSQLEARLPIIQVGSPVPPHLYWPLFLDTPSNGSRGVLSVEDADRFGVAQRILTSSETFVIPRLGAASGQSLTYRLEPFVPTLGVGNDGRLSLLTIPFRFPSGSLTVRIHQPDGTERVLGPTPFVQSRLKSLVDEEGNLLDAGGGHISNAYQLSTMDPRFEVEFTQDGLHVIAVEGTIDDIWGHTWSGGGTYDVHVGRVLALDTAVLPGTHFEVGDGFNPGLVVSPPVTAEVEVRLQHVPHSDINQLQERVIRGRTNRFGYFQPAGNSVIFEQPGEYRVDITATGHDEQGQQWMGSRTWGGVVAPVDPLIVAHGRRGIETQETIGPQWFTRDQIGIWIGSGKVPLSPFSRVMCNGLKIKTPTFPLLSFHDPSRRITALMQQKSIGSGL